MYSAARSRSPIYTGSDIDYQQEPQYSEFWNQRPVVLTHSYSPVPSISTVRSLTPNSRTPTRNYSSQLYITSPDSGFQGSRPVSQRIYNRSASAIPMTQSQASLRRSTGSMDRITSSSAGRRTYDPDLPEIKNIKDSRRELHGLNEKLASQMERIRFLNAENQKLTNDVANLKANWGRETEKVRALYDDEMRQLRTLVDDTERQKSEALAKAASLQQTNRDLKEDLAHLRKNQDKLASAADQSMAELTKREGELLNCQRRMQAMEDQMAQMKAALDKATHDCKACTRSLDEETALRMATQSEMQTLREELDFLRRVHDQQLREMQELAAKTDNQQRDNWQNEFSKALRDIQQDYDRKQKEIQEELENHFAAKLRNMAKLTPQEKQEIIDLRAENEDQRSFIEKLRGQINRLQQRNDHLEATVKESAEEIDQLRHRLDQDYAEAVTERRNIEEALTRTRDEMADLMDTKLNLEAEIAAYRHLLEAQDGLIGTMSDGKSQNGYQPNNFPGKTQHPPTVTITGRPTANRNSETTKRWSDRQDPAGSSTRSTKQQ
ncbi:Lamin A C, partial [Cichlidogyrus casuarinus]